MRMPHQLFAGCFPTGIVYADRCNLENGDYKRLAFLSFQSLELSVEPTCVPRLREHIERHAKAIQAQRGMPYQISECGQTVILGSSGIRAREGNNMEKIKVTIDVCDWGYLIDTQNKERKRDMIVEEIISEVKSLPNIDQIADAFDALYNDQDYDSALVDAIAKYEQIGFNRILVDVCGYSENDPKPSTGCNFNIAIEKTNE